MDLLSSLTHSWIGLLIVGESTIILVMTFYVLMFLTFRGIWEKQEAKLEKKVNEALLNYMLESMERDPSKKVTIELKPTLVNRNLYRQAILAQIESLAGFERDAFCELYKAFGFFQEDLRSLHSYFWSTRLTALVRLDQLSFPECAPALFLLIDDRKTVIALAAAKALSRIKHPLCNMKIIDQLGKRAFLHDDALLEIVSNIALGLHSFEETEGAQGSGASKVLAYLIETPHPTIALACVRVLGALRHSEAVPALTQSLESASSLPEKLIIAIVDALKLIGDPACIHGLRPLLNWSSARVKSRTILALSHFRDPLSLPKIGSLRNDPSIEVQRALAFAIPQTSDAVPLRDVS